MATTTSSTTTPPPAPVTATPPAPATPAQKQKLFVFGLGFSAARAALAFHERGFEVAGTSRTLESATQLAAQHPHVFRVANAPGDDGAAAVAPRNAFVFDGAQWDASNGVSVEEALAGVTHVIVSVPTGRVDGQEDPVLFALGERLLASVRGSLQWLAYLSTIGVYGETHGAVVDESAPVQSSVKRSQMRIAAERQWLATGLPVHVFRIAGIYGPGRGTLTKVRSGTATRIELPGRLFNRVHVDDIVQVLLASAARPRAGAVYNVCDDEPAPADEVTAFACELLGVPVVPSQTWAEAEAGMSAMAKSFYAESKVCSNALVKRELGVALRYPSYREGLLAQLLEEEAADAEGRAGAAPCRTSTEGALVVLVNIGSLRPEPFLDLRQLSFRLSRALRRPVVPCSFRFSHRVPARALHGIAAQSFESVVRAHLAKRRGAAAEIVALPLFFGPSATLSEFLPETLAACWRDARAAEQDHHSPPPQSLALRLGACLVDVAMPEDDRVAQLLAEKVGEATRDVPPGRRVAVLVLDHGTPSRAVHAVRELVGEQLRARLAGRVARVATACMERRAGAEFDFNDPLLEVALEHHGLADADVVVVALLFLSQGRHAGAGGDVDEILAGVRERHPGVDLRATEPLGAHELLAQVLQDRYHSALAKPAPDFEFTPECA